MGTNRSGAGPVLVAIVGIIAFVILVYMVLSGAFWVIERIFNLGSPGTPI